MTERPLYESSSGFEPPRRNAWFRWVVTGCVLGGLAGAFVPRAYIAETTLLFPTINDTVLKETAKVLKVDASQVEWSKTAAINDSDMVDAAGLLLKSRAAIQSSFRDAKLQTPPTIPLLQGDPIEYFRTHNVEVLAQRGNSLTLQVRAVRAEAARSLCQGLLNYYTTFVHEHRLTNTARARQQLEEKLVRVDRRLGVLEKKLLAGSGGRFRMLGDAQIRPDPKLLKELWKQRLLEAGSSGRVLDEMRKVRKDAGNSPSPETDIGEDWRSRWGSETLDKGREDLPRDTRQKDLPSRLELERVYEETLLLYHSGLLQHDFLTMWETLEDFDFEVVDPISIRHEEVGWRALLWSFWGALVGLILGKLVRRSG